MKVILGVSPFSVNSEAVADDLFRLKRGSVDADWAEKATELLAEVQLNLDLVG